MYRITMYCIAKNIISDKLSNSHFSQVAGSIHKRGEKHIRLQSELNVSKITGGILAIKRFSTLSEYRMRLDTD